MTLALQCLLNVQPLMDYFLSDLHEYEMNEKNPLGSQGAITAAFADLVKYIINRSQTRLFFVFYLPTLSRDSRVYSDIN